VGYANPHATASAVVQDDVGRILLGLRAGEPEAGKWDLPGGFLEEGEHPLAALVRELREETGLEVEPLELVAIEIDVYGEGPEAPSTLNLYWTARPLSGQSQAADDVAELRWFAPDELPDDVELAFRGNARVLARFRGSPGSTER
jgi:8-oxo-dGTP diphosphatase